MNGKCLRSAVLLDLHPLWLEAVEPVIESLGGEVLAKTIDPETALAVVEERQPDLLLTEMMLGNGGADAAWHIERALERAPHVKVIVLSAQTAAPCVRAALAAGATAYVHKTVDRDALASAIRQAFENSAPPTRRVGFEVAGPAEAPEELDTLTRRERETMRLVADGRSNAEIARELSITVQTVKLHLSRAYRKIGVSNRTQAARWAQMNGLVDSVAATPADRRVGSPRAPTRSSSSP